MATLRDLRKRLRAVRNTAKITKAMKMVAASKFRRAQQAILHARPYATRMNQVLMHIVEHADVTEYPLLQTRVPRRVELVVMTSDRGLCGGFNSSILRASERWLADHQHEYERIGISTIGRKASAYFARRGDRVVGDYTEVWDDLRFERASEIAEELAERYRGARLDAVFLLFNEFRSALSQNVTTVQLLPIRPLEAWEDEPQVRVGELAPVSGQVRAVAGFDQSGAYRRPDLSEWKPSEPLVLGGMPFDHIYEPSKRAVLDVLLPQHLAIQIWRALLESMAAEHGARMTVMDAASRNAKELIDKLTLEANRVRQAAITKELMEIVSGAEVLGR
jgi:F-type H+-transporting ATPase subunit gamma